MCDVWQLGHLFLEGASTTYNTIICPRVHLMHACSCTRVRMPVDHRMCDVKPARRTCAARLVDAASAPRWRWSSSRAWMPSALAPVCMHVDACGCMWMHVDACACAHPPRWTPSALAPPVPPPAAHSRWPAAREGLRMRRAPHWRRPVRLGFGVRVRVLGLGLGLGSGLHAARPSLASAGRHTHGCAWPPCDHKSAR